MATTVNDAFSEFIKTTINLDDDISITARASRDNLIHNIDGFSGDNDFFVVYTEKNLKYGSFARRTKIKPLDDIDIMICFSASNDGERRSYLSWNDCTYIEGIGFDAKNNLLTYGTTHLNSTKVINRLISKLSKLSDYSKAEMHKNQEAATLKLKSYTWNFDIVPCFYTDTGLYLIPDGSGNWKKTDPRIDNNRITVINQKHKGNVLSVIRLIKYWNERKITLKIGSYMLECMALSFYESLDEKENYWVDLELRDLFYHLANAIYKSVPDPKNIQGDLNTFSWTERNKISEALSTAYEKANEASQLEFSNQKAAINKWREVLGPSFPSYTG